MPYSTIFAALAHQAPTEACDFQGVWQCDDMSNAQQDYCSSLPGLKAGARLISTGSLQQQEHHKQQAEQFAHKELHQSADKVDAKAQVIFDTCWRRLETKFSQVCSQFDIVLFSLQETDAHFFPLCIKVEIQWGNLPPLKH